MPKYEITYFYHLWTRATVEADNEKEAFEKLDPATLVEVERSWEDCDIEEAFDDDFS